jgi:hypothetical protein
MDIKITNTRSNPLLQDSIDRAFNKNGFGSRIPTDQMVQINGGKRWYRVYHSFVAQYDPTGNYNYAFINYKGREIRWFKGTVKICPRH